MGRYYNRIPLVVPLRELEPVRIFVEYQASLIDPEACTQLQEDNPNSDIPCGGTQLEGGIDPFISIQTVDRNLTTPYQDELTFKVERELWAETSVSFQYIKRSFKNQLQDTNIILDVGDKGRCFKSSKEENGPVIPSPGMGQTLTDPYTGIQYVDTDPGPGDGYLAAGFSPLLNSVGKLIAPDDCAGERLFTFPPEGCDPQTDPFCSETQSLQRPDGVRDLYIQNPFWGDIFLIGNVNTIDYEAYVLELVRRQYRSWEMNASYTWSEAFGDGEDFFQGLGDDPTLKGNVFGFQSYDQTHVVKLNATTITPWGVRLGTAVTWQSGLPYSILLQEFSDDVQAPITSTFGGEGARPRQTYPTGQRNDQRNASFWNFDVKATKELRLGKGMNLQLSAEIFNLLDDGTYQVYNPFLERGQQLNGVNEAQSRFGRRWQVGMKLAF